MTVGRGMEGEHGLSLWSLELSLPNPLQEVLRWHNDVMLLPPFPLHGRRVSCGKTLGGADLYQRWET